MVSFSRVVKEDVVFNDFESCCQKAMLCAIIKINGTLSLSSYGLSLTIRTENAKIASKIHKMLKDEYDPQIEFIVSRKMKLKKNNVYILKVTKAREILDDLSLMDGLGFQTSNYHLEMSFAEEEYANFIAQLMNNFELNAKIIKRRNRYVVYLKSSEKIGDFLRAMGASRSVMNFESTRIDRNMSNTVNRWNNCDIANEIKSLASANKQIDDINTVDMFMGLEMLDEKTRSVALIRRKYPEMSLNELAQVYYEETGQTISKSGLHHRFKKISDEAKRLIQMENE